MRNLHKKNNVYETNRQGRKYHSPKINTAFSCHLWREWAEPIVRELGVFMFLEHGKNSNTTVAPDGSDIAREMASSDQRGQVSLELVHWDDRTSV
jgi:hypothetical protein